MQPFRVEKDKEDVTLGFLHSVSACMIYLHLNAEHSRSLISPCYEFCIEAIYCLIENYLLYQLKSEGWFVSFHYIHSLQRHLFPGSLGQDQPMEQVASGTTCADLCRKMDLESKQKWEQSQLHIPPLFLARHAGRRKVSQILKRDSATYSSTKAMPLCFTRRSQELCGRCYLFITELLLVRALVLNPGSQSKHTLTRLITIKYCK